MLNVPTTLTDLERVKTAYLSVSLAQVAATYDLGTVSGGDVLILDAAPYNSVAATGLVSMTVQTNDTTPTTILASTLLNALTGGVNLTAFTTRTVLPSGKKIQATIVGTGTAGTLKLAVRYQPLANGAVLA